MHFEKSETCVLLPLANTAAKVTNPPILWKN